MTRKWTVDDSLSNLGSRTLSLSGAISSNQAGTALLLESDPAAEAYALSARAEWQLACRVASSKGLTKSEFLRRFLLYVCRESLLGRASEITEQRIGTQIFNRPADYDPGEDNIVRSYARLLRKRLETYFDEEGSDEPMRIVIPRGGYVPVFETGPAVQEPVSTRDEPAPHEAESACFGAHVLEEAQAIQSEPDRQIEARSGSRSIWLSGLVGLAAGILLTSTAWIGVKSFQAQRVEGPAHAVWKQMFQFDRDTLIVPSDSALGILENLTGHPVSVEEYANRSYLTDIPAPPGLNARNFNDLRRQRYTSVVSLDITAMLTQLPEFIADRTQIRYARGITAEDIKNRNVILLGSIHTNPWVSLFEKRVNFKLEYTPEVDDSYVLNEHPEGTEQKIYRNGTEAVSNHTYGAIAYLPGLDGTGHVLVIQGLNMAATQAAADTLFQGNAIRQILRQAELPNGALRSFELLVETTSIGATAPESQIIATRIYPQ